MSYRPVFLAFVAAALGAALVGLSLQFAPGRADWPALMLGVYCTAAMTGLVASGAQFLPSRHYGLVTAISGIFVAVAVGVLLRTAEFMGIGRVTLATNLVWAVAVVVALIVTREAGHRLPQIQKPVDR